MIELATRWTVARQVFGLAYHKAGQLRALCSVFQEVPEPRPTKSTSSQTLTLVEYLPRRATLTG
jgi:hypothetical protein